MANPWMTHLAKVRKSNPGKSLKVCMKIASKSYKKGKRKGGAMSVGGSIRIGGKIKKKRRGGLFRPTSKKRSQDFAEDVFEGSLAASAIPGAAPFALAAAGGAAIGSGIVELLDSIF